MIFSELVLFKSHAGSTRHPVVLDSSNQGATDFYPGIFFNYGSIWWLEKEMHLDLFIAYLTQLNLTHVILLELCSQCP